jgi:hypothetical protein
MHNDFVQPGFIYQRSNVNQYSDGGGIDEEAGILGACGLIYRGI